MPNFFNLFPSSFLQRVGAKTGVTQMCDKILRFYDLQDALVYSSITRQSQFHYYLYHRHSVHSVFILENEKISTKRRV